MKKAKKLLRKLLVVSQEHYKAIVLTILIAGGAVLTKEYLSPRQKSSLNLGYMFFGSINEIDPINIQSIYQANIIENIYSRLVDYDKNGQIVCSLCSSFQIDKNNIIFLFENSSRSVSGKAITAADAKASLDRLMKTQTNTHGSLEYYLEEKDTAIKVENSKLTLSSKKDAWAPFVLSLLTSMDFSVVPISSLDKTHEKIINYRETSGPFFVDASDTAGRLILKGNPNHLQYSEKMPERINFIPIHSGEASQAFLNQTIDMIEVSYFAYDDDINKIVTAIPDVKVHETLRIGLTSLVFTSRAMANSTPQERLSAGIAIKDIYNKNARKIYGAENTDEFFQSFGQGFITTEQRESLSQSRAKSERNSARRFTFGVTEKFRHLLKPEDFPSFIELKFFPSYPGFLPEKDRPDIFIINTDSSFDEDISALSYLFSQGTFSLSKESGATWIQKYMDITSKKDRISHLRDLHFQMLNEVKVFPISSQPYVTISTKKWDFDFPKIYAGAPLWKVWEK